MKRVLMACVGALALSVAVSSVAKADEYDEVVAQCPAMKGRETREVANQNVRDNGGVARMVQGFKAMGWCGQKVKARSNRRRAS